MMSINTNAGAILAQKFLRATSAEMSITQNRVSSGLRVSTVTDDSSSFAVAAGINVVLGLALALGGLVLHAPVAIEGGLLVGANEAAVAERQERRDAERRHGEEGDDEARDHRPVHERRPSPKLIDVHVHRIVGAHAKPVPSLHPINNRQIAARR